MESRKYSPEHTGYYRAMTNFDRFLKTTQLNCSPSQFPRILGPSQSFQTEEDDNESLSYTPKHKKIKTEFDSVVKIKKLELEHSSAKKAQIKANIDLESQCAKLKSENGMLREKCGNFEHKCSEATRQSLQLVDQLEDIKKNKIDGVSKWENNYLYLLKQKNESEEKILTKMNELTHSVNELKSQNMILTSQLGITNLDLKEANDQLELHKQKSNQVADLLTENEELSSALLNSKQEINNLNLRLENASEAEKMATIFKEDMNRLRLLERANQSLLKKNEALKQDRENCLLLKEQLLSAEEKLERASTKINRVPQLEVELETLQAKLNTFKTQTLDENEANILKNEVKDLQENVIKPLQLKNSILENELKSCVTNKNDDKKNRSNLQSKIDEQNETIISLNAQLLRMRRKAALSTHERDSLRSILSTYDSELTIDTQSSLILKRLEVSEESNNSLQSQIKELEKELEKHMKSGQNKSFVNVEKNNAEILKISEELKEALKLIEKLKTDSIQYIDKIEQLESLIEQSKIKGLYDAQSSKVVHFSLNPADLAHQKSKQDILDLKSENVNLKNKLAKLQQGLEISVSEMGDSQEVIKKLYISELQNKRLKEAFSKKIQEFRRVYYSLTGFTVSSVSDSKFRVTSQYAENENDFLLFELKPSGQVDMLETEYSKTLDEFISLHLGHQNSIPMFLCAVTTNLFSQQTIVIE